MNAAWRRACVGLAAGLFQSPAYVLPQFIGAIAITVAVAPEQLAWIAPVAYLLAVPAGLLAAAGDLVGGRTLILAIAGTSLTGVTLVACAGLAAAFGMRSLAFGLVVLGACLAPIAVRHGALVVASETQGLGMAEQLDRSRALRRFLVLGIYLIPLPAGLVGERHGWTWVFGSLALAQGIAFALLWRYVGSRRAAPPVPPPAFARELAAGFSDRRLARAAAAAFFAQAAVFGYVGGLPIRLGQLEFTATAIGAVMLTAVLAAVFVGRPRSWTAARFGRTAGAAPVVGLAAIAAATIGASPGDRGGSAVVYVATLGIATVLIELSKQWSQTIALMQARIGASGDHDFRRQTVVGLGANVGTIAGAWLGVVAAMAGHGSWLWLLSGAAVIAWALQAAGFAHRPAHARTRGRHRRPRML